jgi:hypothetical protein
VENSETENGGGSGEMLQVLKKQQVRSVKERTETPTENRAILWRKRILTLYAVERRDQKRKEQTDYIHAIQASTRTTNNRKILGQADHDRTFVSDGKFPFIRGF